MISCCCWLTVAFLILLWCLLILSTVGFLILLGSFLFICAQLLPPGHVWLGDCCWQVFQLMLLKCEIFKWQEADYGRIHYFSGGFPLVSNLRVWFLNKYVWFWFQCHRLYLTHRDDSIILEDISDVKASSDQGTQEVFKGGQSTLLNPSCFDFTQCSAHHWLWLSPSIFPDNNTPDNLLRPARVHNEVNDPGHHSQNIGQHLASILDIRSTHNTPPEVQTTWSKKLSLIFHLQAHLLSD